MVRLLLLSLLTDSFTWRSRTFQFVCYCISLQACLNDASRESHDIQMLPRSFTLSRAGEGQRLEQHLLLFWSWGCGSTPVRRGKLCFLTLSYCCFNCDFKYMMIVWRQMKDCCAGTVMHSLHSDWFPLQVVLMFACHLVLFTLVSNVPCLFGGMVPLLQMWNFNLTFFYYY